MNSGLDGKRGVRPVFEAKPAPAPHGIEPIPFPGLREQDRHSMLANDRIPGEMISLNFYKTVTLTSLWNSAISLSCSLSRHNYLLPSNPSTKKQEQSKMTRFWDIFSQFYPPKPKFTELDVPDLRGKVNSCSPSACKLAELNNLINRSTL
jgi:hypothetical protein